METAKTWWKGIRPDSSLSSECHDEDLHGALLCQDKTCLQKMLHSKIDLNREVLLYRVYDLW